MDQKPPKLLPLKTSVFLKRGFRPQKNPSPEPLRRPSWYRRKYLVSPRFQITLIFANLAITIGLFCLTVFLVVRSHLFLELMVKQTRLPAQGLFIELLTEQLRTLLIYMGIALLIGTLISVVSTLFISHKMAGPMLRLRNYFLQISRNGDFPQDLKFREGDFFRDLPPAINSAFSALQKKWFR